MQAAPEVRVNVVLSNLGDFSTSGLISLLKSSDGSSNGARVESLEQHLTVGISESVSTYTLKKAANALSTAACETFSGCATEISTLSSPGAGMSLPSPSPPAKGSSASLGNTYGSDISSSDDSSGFPVAAIGGACAAVLVVALIIAYVICRRRKGRLGARHTLGRSSTRMDEINIHVDKQPMVTAGTVLSAAGLIVLGATSGTIIV